MSPFSRLRIAIKAARQLGLTAVTLNALYKLGLKAGYFRLVDHRPQTIDHRPSSIVHHLFSLPSREQLLAVLGPAGLEHLTRDANEIVAGKYRQFACASAADTGGGEPVEINLQPPTLRHWTECETAHHATDIKFTWEPARFGWAFTLGRAYHATGDEKYAEAFWRYFEDFQAANPPYFGENWMNGQEAGLRLMAFAWAGQVFRQAKQTSPSRLAALAASIGIHAARIPATLLYARSQNNNHLLTEAAALYTAALALPDHPDFDRWLKTGQEWLNWCFENQIDETGEYVQHSTNYHRLMLQTALWASGVRRQVSGAPLAPDPSPLTPRSRENLARATHWLLSLLDPTSGGVPNLGANDGAYIFPLSSLPFNDFRPVAHAAARAFIDYTPTPGPWNEMALWFGLPRGKSLSEIPSPPSISPHFPVVLRKWGDERGAPNSWGYLRAARYKSRPSHADQLHFDLWWRGWNIAQDAGTYSYNASPPWDNRLASTLVHNTVTVDGQEQMTRVSRFLYLDWADATAREHPTDGEAFLQRISAQTEAYAHLGVHHTRTVTVYPDERWRVEDELLNRGQAPRAYRLHWLLPDWEWEVENRDSIFEIRLKSPQGCVTLHIDVQPATMQPSTTLVRAGEVVWGNLSNCPTTRGWVSPTYSVKNPALSLAVEVQSAGTVQFTTDFIFPTIDDGQ